MYLDSEERSISCISDIPESLKDKIDYLDTDFDILKINSNKNKEKENCCFFESKKKILKINLDEIIEEQSYELEMSALERNSKRSDNLFNNNKIENFKQCSFNSDNYQNINDNKSYLNRILSKKDINNKEIIRINNNSKSIDFKFTNTTFRNFLVKISPKNENLDFDPKTEFNEFLKLNIENEIEKTQKIDKILTFKKKKNLIHKKKKKDFLFENRNLSSKKMIKNLIFKKKNTKIKIKNRKEPKISFYKSKYDLITTRNKKNTVSLILSNKKDKILKKKKKKNNLNKRKITSKTTFNSGYNSIKKFSTKDFSNNKKSKISKNKLDILNNYSKTMKSFFNNKKLKNRIIKKKEKIKKEKNDLINVYKKSCKKMDLKNTKLFLKKNYYYELFKNKNKSLRGVSKSRFSHSSVNKKELFKNNFFKTIAKKKNNILDQEKKRFSTNFCLYQNYKNCNNNLLVKIN